MMAWSKTAALLRRVPACAFVLAVLSCGGWDEPPPTDAIIAEIGQQPVTLSQFERYVSVVSEEDIPLVGGELKSALLDQLIEELLLLRAANDEGIEMSPEEVQARESEIPPVADGDQAAEGPVNLSARNPSDLVASLKVKKLLDAKILKGVQVTDEEIVAHYERNRVYYRRPASVDISQILVEAEEQANQLLAELNSNPSRFEGLAAQHSLGPEATESGHMGTFRRGELPTAFETEVFDLKRGELSGVVKTDFGFHIFRVNATYPAKDLSLEDVEATIRVDLLRQKSDEKLALFLLDLERRYPVWIDTEKLDFPYLNQNGYDVEPRAEAEGRSQNAGR